MADADVLAEARALRANSTWRTDDLHALRLRYAELLLRIADHKTAHRHNQSQHDRRLWQVLEEEAF